MSEQFTPQEIEMLTDEINQQLRELEVSDPASLRAKGGRPRAERQRKAIEQATGQDASTFLARFRAAARKDLCEKGGVLHAQWEKYHDLASKDMLKTFGGLVVGLGFTGNSLAVVAVAISVYVLHLGVEAFCAGTD